LWRKDSYGQVGKKESWVWCWQGKVDNFTIVLYTSVFPSVFSLNTDIVKCQLPTHLTGDLEVSLPNRKILQKV
jgi:hypothetical protein